MEQLLGKRYEVAQATSKLCLSDGGGWSPRQQLLHQQTSHAPMSLTRGSGVLPTEVRELQCGVVGGAEEMCGIIRVASELLGNSY